MIFFLSVSIAVARVWEHMAEEGYCERDEQKIFRAVDIVRKSCERCGISFYGENTDGDETRMESTQTEV